MHQSAEPGIRERTFRSADRSGRPRRLNRGPSKCGNLLTEVAKNWISRRPKKAEFFRRSRDFELREASQNLDFQVRRNAGTYSRNSRFRAPGIRPKLGFRGTSKQGNALVGRRSFGIRGICQNPPFPDHKTVEFGAESPDFEPRGTSHPDPGGPDRPNRGPGNGPFDPRIDLAGRVAYIADHQNAGTCSRKSPKIGFPGAAKQRNLFAEVAISSSGRPAKTRISRYMKTGEYVGGASLI